jgi:transposase
MSESGTYTVLKELFADAGYRGSQFQMALVRILLYLGTEIVRGSDRVKGFAVLPKRWIVERTIACSTGAEGLPRIGRTSVATTGFLASRLNPPHAPKDLQSRLMFGDRL